MLRFSFWNDVDGPILSGDVKGIPSREMLFPAHVPLNSDYIYILYGTQQLYGIAGGRSTNGTHGKRCVGVTVKLVSEPELHP
jgi:hypothetical protein